jgi:hypothetical protein
VQDVFFSIGGRLEDPDAAAADYIDAGAGVAFAENPLPFGKGAHLGYLGQTASTGRVDLLKQLTASQDSFYAFRHGYLVSFQGNAFSGMI